MCQKPQRWIFCPPGFWHKVFGPPVVLFLRNWWFLKCLSLWYLAEWRGDKVEKCSTLASTENAGWTYGKNSIQSCSRLETSAFGVDPDEFTASQLAEACFHCISPTLMGLPCHLLQRQDLSHRSRKNCVCCWQCGLNIESSSSFLEPSPARTNIAGLTFRYKKPCKAL